MSKASRFYYACNPNLCVYVLYSVSAFRLTLVYESEYGISVSPAVRSSGSGNRHLRSVTTFAELDMDWIHPWIGLEMDWVGWL